MADVCEVHGCGKPSVAKSGLVMKCAEHLKSYQTGEWVWCSSEEECLRPAAPSGRHRCSLHGGKDSAPPVPRCEHAGCEAEALPGGRRCYEHRGGDVCNVHGCGKRPNGTYGLCDEHWESFKSVRGYDEDAYRSLLSSLSTPKPAEACAVRGCSETTSHRHPHGHSSFDLLCTTHHDEYQANPEPFSRWLALKNGALSCEVRGCKAPRYKTAKDGRADADLCEGHFHEERDSALSLHDWLKEKNAPETKPPKGVTLTVHIDDTDARAKLAELEAEAKRACDAMERDVAQVLAHSRSLHYSLTGQPLNAGLSAYAGMNLHAPDPSTAAAMGRAVSEALAATQRATACGACGRPGSYVYVGPPDTHLCDDCDSDYQQMEGMSPARFVTLRRQGVEEMHDCARRGCKSKGTHSYPDPKPSGEVLYLCDACNEKYSKHELSPMRTWLAHVNGGTMLDALDTLATDAGDAGYRIAARQIVKLAHEPSIAFLAAHFGDDLESGKARVVRFLATDVGRAIYASALALGISTLPLPDGLAEHRDRLVRELRVGAMSEIGDTLADVLMGPLRQVISLYLSAPPVEKPRGLEAQKQERIEVAEVETAQARVGGGR